MGDYTAVRPNIYTTGAIIYAANHNLNETTLYSAHNAAINASTGHGHTGTTGDGPLIGSSGLRLITDLAQYAGADRSFFSDAYPGTALTIKEFGDSGIIWGAPQADGAYGVTCSLASGRFSITANSAAASDTNPAYVVMNSTTAGQKVSLRINSTGHWFDDDTAATSSIVGEQFGVTTGRAWTPPRPFFVYACNATNASSGLAFFISPCPTLTTSPATANIGYRGVPMATPSDLGGFFLTATDVTATHNGKPCLLIGSIDMTMTSSDDWTVAALTNLTGIGNYPWTTRYSMAISQMGASSGTYMVDNGGTAPIFTTNNLIYSLSVDGWCSFEYELSGDGGTDGAGAVTAYVVTPYKANFTTPANIVFGSGAASFSAGDAVTLTLFMDQSASRIYMTTAGNATNDYAVVQNVNFGNGSRSLYVSGRYKAF